MYSLSVEVIEKSRAVVLWMSYDISQSFVAVSSLVSCGAVDSGL